MASVGKLIVELEAKGVKLTKAQLKQLEGQGKKTGMSLKGMALSLGASTIAMYAMQKAIMGSIRVGKEFEQSMANVKAISGATGAEFNKLESSAKKLGASTKFTASQVAGLQTEYAKLGFSTKEILGAQSATLALAAATGAELPRASEVAGATLRGFGIDAQDTGRITDVMALSFSKSALDMERFSESMKFVAPVAKSAGFSVEGTTAILAKMADVGIHGSLAGTALKNIFGDLAGESSKLSKRLGGPTTSMEQLAPKLQKLKAEGFGLTEALDLVGRRSAPAFLALVEGSDDLEGLTQQFNEAGGAAQRMAEIQLDTLQGKMTILNSATEGLGIALFERMAPGLKDATDGFTDLVSSVTNLISIKPSEEINSQMVEFNSLVLSLRDVNLLEENRKKIITDIQTKYGSYIDNIDLEKAGYDELTTALENANKEFMKKIRLESQRELIAEQEKRIADLMKEQVKTSLDNERIKQGDFTILESIFGQMRLQVGEAGRLKKINEEIPAEIAKQLEEIQKINEIIAKLTGDAEDAPEGGVIGSILNGKNGNNVKDVIEELTLYEDFIKNFTNTHEALNKVTEENVANNILLGKSYADAKKPIQAMGNAAVASALESANASVTSAVITWIVNFMKTTPLPAVFSGPLALAGGAAFGAGIGSLMQAVPKFAKGGDYVTDGPEMIMVGDNPGGQERVQVTPLSSPNISGPQGSSITVNISGNVMSQDYVEGELADTIKEAVRKGNDFGMS